MNAWFTSKNPDMADVVRIDLQPGTLTAELRVGDGEKRLTMKATLALLQSDDNLLLQLQSVHLGKFRVPDAILEEALTKDLTQAVFGDPESLARFHSVVERVEIKEDAFLFVPRQNVK